MKFKWQVFIDYARAGRVNQKLSQIFSGLIVVGQDRNVTKYIW